LDDAVAERPKLDAARDPSRRVTPFASNRRMGPTLFRSSAIVKPVLGVAATGVLALLLWKLVLVFLLPWVGAALGLAFLVAKAVLIGTMICIAIWLFRRWTRREEKLA
jgi:hypothetical protein